MTEDRLRPTRQTFQQTERLLDDFFKVDVYRGQYERYDGTMSDPQRLLVFERGDSVAALLFDPLHKEVILVEQFRLPTLKKGQLHGWLLEPAAGMLKDDETREQCAVREIREETGYQVSSLVPISTFFLSPGGSSERIHLFYAEVRRTQQVEAGGGKTVDGENVDVVRMPVAEFFSRLRNREFEDAKLIVAGYWLKDRLGAMSVSLVADWRKEAFELDLPPVPGWFGTKSTPKKFVGYISGDIRDVTDIEAWVNPLTSEMLLDKFSDRTISAVIRTRGAETFDNDDNLIKTDLVGDALRAKMCERVQVHPGIVITTTPGQLASRNGVKKVVHVAIAHGPLGERPRTSMDILGSCIDNVLTEIDRKLRLRSVLLPMIGTGPEGLPVNQVAPMLLDRVIRYFKDNPHTVIERVYLLAYSEIDFDELKRAFQARHDAFKPSAILLEGLSDVSGMGTESVAAQA